jgi:excisionase family DNA binding protein
LEVVMALKSIQKAADTWGVSVYTVRRLATAGLVRTVRVGRRRLVSESEIERIVATGVPSAATGEEAMQPIPRKRRGE